MCIYIYCCISDTMIQLICIDTVGRVSDHEHLTGRPQGDRIDAVKNSRILAPWWPRISMSWVKRRGFCSHGCFSILFLFSALNEGWLLVVLRIVQKSSKKNPKSLLLHEKAGQHATILHEKLQYLTLVEKNGPMLQETSEEKQVLPRVAEQKI